MLRGEVGGEEGGEGVLRGEVGGVGLGGEGVLRGEVGGEGWEERGC